MGEFGLFCDPSGLDRLIHSYQCENEQLLKLIEIEKQNNEGIGKETKTKKEMILQLETSNSKLDEETRRAHKQFTINKDNCESLRKTLIVLKDHEEALTEKLDLEKKKYQEENLQRGSILKQYTDIWTDYKAKYESFPLAKQLKQIQDEVSQLRSKVTGFEKTKRELQAMMQKMKGNKTWNEFKQFCIFFAKNRVKIEEKKMKILKGLNETQKIEEKMKVMTAEKEAKLKAEQLQRNMMETNEADVSSGCHKNLKKCSSCTDLEDTDSIMISVFNDKEEQEVSNVQRQTTDNIILAASNDIPVSQNHQVMETSPVPERHKRKPSLKTTVQQSIPDNKLPKTIKTGLYTVPSLIRPIVPHQIKITPIERSHNAKSPKLNPVSQVYIVSNVQQPHTDLPMQKDVSISNSYKGIQNTPAISSSPSISTLQQVPQFDHKMTTSMDQATPVQKCKTNDSSPVMDIDKIQSTNQLKTPEQRKPKIEHFSPFDVEKHQKNVQELLYKSPGWKMPEGRPMFKSRENKERKDTANTTLGNFMQLPSDFFMNFESKNSPDIDEKKSDRNSDVKKAGKKSKFSVDEPTQSGNSCIISHFDEPKNNVIGNKIQETSFIMNHGSNNNDSTNQCVSSSYFEASDTPNLMSLLGNSNSEADNEKTDSFALNFSSSGNTAENNLFSLFGSPKNSNNGQPDVQFKISTNNSKSDSFSINFGNSSNISNNDSESSKFSGFSSSFGGRGDSGVAGSSLLSLFGSPQTGEKTDENVNIQFGGGDNVATKAFKLF